MFHIQPPSDTIYQHLEIPPAPDDVKEHYESIDISSPLPPSFAYGELSCVRIAYLRAVHNNVFGNMPVRQTNLNLSACLDSLEAGGILPELPVPAQTLETAKRRLGLDPDEFIIQYAICPVCWKHYSPLQMQQLDAPLCTVEGCAGLIYTEDPERPLKREVNLILPQVSLIQQIRRLMRRKGIRKHLRDSTNPPADRTMEEENDYMMKDMYDGKMWEDLYTNIHREVGDLGTVRDVTAEGTPKERLSRRRFGLHCVLNMDW